MTPEVEQWWKELETKKLVSLLEITAEGFKTLSISNEKMIPLSELLNEAAKRLTKE